MFLLVVLAALVAVVSTSSIVMRFVQHRQRYALRRRIVAGEVDLEALGVKRLKVPQHILDKMPLYTYDKDGHPVAPAPAHVAGDSKSERITPDITNLAVPTTSNSAHPLSPGTQGRVKSSFSQTTCPICLDDYESGESIVRELPCQHIFHPDCVDSFLLENSSLCPVCKTSVFPPGYCPEMVTDAMVRQERFARRHHRDGNTQDMLMEDIESPYRLHPRRRMRAIFAGRLGRSRRTEAQVAPPAPTATAPTPAPAGNNPTPTPGTIGRREEMRRRAVAMLGHRRMAEDEDRERQASRPKCEQFTY